MVDIIERLRHKDKVKPGQQVRVLPADVLSEIDKRDAEIERLKRKQEEKHALEEKRLPG